MGEYANYGGQRVKIGTCEDMFYLRADQRQTVMPLSGNVNPTSARDLAAIRFRFPFPDEDGIEPGAFERFDRVIGLYGVEVPADLEHGKIQFVAREGYNVMLPCPESEAGKTSGLPFFRNGHPGPVQFGQQALRGGLWVLIGRCGGCGYPYRYETLAEVEPVLVAVRAEGDRWRREDEQKAAWFHTVADRILAGYAKPSC